MADGDVTAKLRLRCWYDGIGKLRDNVWYLMHLSFFLDVYIFPKATKLLPSKRGSNIDGVFIKIDSMVLCCYDNL